MGGSRSEKVKSESKKQKRKSKSGKAKAKKQKRKSKSEKAKAKKQKRKSKSEKAKAKKRKSESESEKAKAKKQKRKSKSEKAKAKKKKRKSKTEKAKPKKQKIEMNALKLVNAAAMLAGAAAMTSSSSVAPPVMAPASPLQGKPKREGLEAPHTAGLRGGRYGKCGAHTAVDALMKHAEEEDEVRVSEGAPPAPLSRKVHWGVMRVVRLVLSHLREVLSCGIILFFIAVCVSALAAAGGCRLGRSALKKLTFGKLNDSIEDAGALKLVMVAFGSLMFAVASMKLVFMFEFVGVNMPVSVRDSDLRKAMEKESSDFLSDIDLLPADAAKNQHSGIVTKANHCSQTATVALTGQNIEINIPMSELKEEEVRISEKYLKIDGCTLRDRKMCCSMYEVKERRFLFDRLFLAPMRIPTSFFLKCMLKTNYVEEKRIACMTFRGPVWVYGSKESGGFGRAGTFILVAMFLLVLLAMILFIIPNSEICHYGSAGTWEKLEQPLSLGALMIISLFGLAFVFALQAYKFFTSDRPVVFGVVLLFIFSKSFMILRILAPWVITMWGVPINKDLAHTTPGFLLGEIPLFFVGAFVAMFCRKNFNPQNGAEVAAHFYFVLAVGILKTVGYYCVFWAYNKSWISGKGWFATMVAAMDRKASWVKVIMTVAIHIVADVGQLGSSFAVKAVSMYCSERCKSEQTETESAPDHEADAQKLTDCSPFARFAIWMERGFTLTVAAPIIEELTHSRFVEFMNCPVTVTPSDALRRLIKSVEDLDGYRAAGS